MSEVYHSQTHGPITLSFEGRRLMQNLRYAIANAIKAQNYSHNADAVARARGDIAARMSALEKRTHEADPYTCPNGWNPAQAQNLANWGTHKMAGLENKMRGLEATVQTLEQLVENQRQCIVKLEQTVELHFKAKQIKLRAANRRRAAKAKRK